MHVFFCGFLIQFYNKFIFVHRRYKIYICFANFFQRFDERYYVFFVNANKKNRKAKQKFDTVKK